jgi:hypothetical protein
MLASGTLDYMAPEVLRCPLKRRPGDNKTRTDLHYATAVDAWAVGVLAFELLTGRCVLAGLVDVTEAFAFVAVVPRSPCLHGLQGVSACEGQVFRRMSWSGLYMFIGKAT